MPQSDVIIQTMHSFLSCLVDFNAYFTNFEQCLHLNASTSMLCPQLGYFLLVCRNMLYFLNQARVETSSSTDTCLPGSPRSLSINLRPGAENGVLPVPKSMESQVVQVSARHRFPAAAIEPFAEGPFGTEFGLALSHGIIPLTMPDDQPYYLTALTAPQSEITVPRCGFSVVLKVQAKASGPTSPTLVKSYTNAERMVWVGVKLTGLGPLNDTGHKLWYNYDAPYGGAWAEGVITANMIENGFDVVLSSSPIPGAVTILPPGPLLTASTPLAVQLTVIHRDDPAGTTSRKYTLKTEGTSENLLVAPAYVINQPPTPALDKTLLPRSCALGVETSTALVQSPGTATITWLGGVTYCADRTVVGDGSVWSVGQAGSGSLDEGCSLLPFNISVHEGDGLGSGARPGEGMTMSNIARVQSRSSFSKPAMLLGLTKAIEAGGPGGLLSEGGSLNRMLVADMFGSLEAETSPLVYAYSNTTELDIPPCHPPSITFTATGAPTGDNSPTRLAACRGTDAPIRTVRITFNTSGLLFNEPLGPSSSQQLLVSMNGGEYVPVGGADGIDWNQKILDGFVDIAVSDDPSIKPRISPGSASDTSPQSVSFRLRTVVGNNYSITTAPDQQLVSKEDADVKLMVPPCFQVYQATGAVQTTPTVLARSCALNESSVSTTVTAKGVARVVFLGRTYCADTFAVRYEAESGGFSPVTTDPIKVPVSGPDCAQYPINVTSWVGNGLPDARPASDSRDIVVNIDSNIHPEAIKPYLDPAYGNPDTDSSSLNYQFVRALKGMSLSHTNSTTLQVPACTVPEFSAIAAAAATGSTSPAAVLDEKAESRKVRVTLNTTGGLIFREPILTSGHRLYYQYNDDGFVRVRGDDVLTADDLVNGFDLWISNNPDTTRRPSIPGLDSSVPSEKNLTLKLVVLIGESYPVTVSHIVVVDSSTGASDVLVAPSYSFFPPGKLLDPVGASLASSYGMNESRQQRQINIAGTATVRWLGQLYCANVLQVGSGSNWVPTKAIDSDTAGCAESEQQVSVHIGAGIPADARPAAGATSDNQASLTTKGLFFMDALAKKLDPSASSLNDRFLRDVFGDGSAPKEVPSPFSLSIAVAPLASASISLKVSCPQCDQIVESRDASRVVYITVEMVGSKGVELAPDGHEVFYRLGGSNSSWVSLGTFATDSGNSTSKHDFAVTIQDCPVGKYCAASSTIPASGGVTSTPDKLDFKVVALIGDLRLPATGELTGAAQRTPNYLVNAPSTGFLSSSVLPASCALSENVAKANLTVTGVASVSWLGKEYCATIVRAGTYANSGNFSYTPHQTASISADCQTVTKSFNLSKAAGISPDLRRPLTVQTFVESLFDSLALTAALDGSGVGGTTGSSGSLNNRMISSLFKGGALFSNKRAIGEAPLALPTCTEPGAALASVVGAAFGDKSSPAANGTWCGGSARTFTATISSVQGGMGEKVTGLILEYSLDNGVTWANATGVSTMAAADLTSPSGFTVYIGNDPNVSPRISPGNGSDTEDSELKVRVKAQFEGAFWPSSYSGITSLTVAGTANQTLKLAPCTATKPYSRVLTEEERKAQEFLKEIGLVGTLERPIAGEFFGKAPVGTMVILPGLVLTPGNTTLPSDLTFGKTPIAFPGNCDATGKPLPAPTSGPLVAVWDLLPPGICFPAGNMYIFEDLKLLGIDQVALDLPDNSVILNPYNVYVPKVDGSSNAGKAIILPNINATWVPVNETGAYNNNLIVYKPGNELQAMQQCMM